MMEIIEVKIKEYVVSYNPGIASGEKSRKNGFIHLRMNNINRQQNLDLSEYWRIPATEREIQSNKIEKGDILFNNTNSPELVGKCCLFDTEVNETVLFSNHNTRIRLNEKIDSQYFVYYLNLLWHKRFFEQECENWVNQAAFRIKEKLLPISIKLPKNKTDQQRIASEIKAKLEKVEQMRQAALKQKEAVDALQGALLREVFPYREGDVLPKGWRWIKIKDVTEFKNGINYSESDVMKGVKIVGVSCFKKHFYVKEELLDEVSADIVRDTDLLQDGDLIVVRSNGNPELVGRHIIFRGYNKVANSGFTIRMRLNSDEIYPEFYLLYAKSSLFREQIKGQGSGISNLSQDKLKTVILPAPKSTVEQKGVTDKLLIKLEKLEGLKRQISTQLEAIEALPAAILREVFDFKP